MWTRWRWSSPSSLECCRWPWAFFWGLTNLGRIGEDRIRLLFLCYEKGYVCCTLYIQYNIYIYIHYAVPMRTRKYINFASGYPKFAMNGPFSEDRKGSSCQGKGRLRLGPCCRCWSPKIGVFLMGNDLGKSYRIWRFFLMGTSCINGGIFPAMFDCQRVTPLFLGRNVSDFTAHQTTIRKTTL